MKVGNAFTRSIFFPFCTLSLSLLQERRFHFAGCKRSHKVWQVIFIVFRNKCLHTNIRHRAFTETQNLGRFLLSDFMDYVQECFSVSAALIMFNNWIESNVHCEKEKRIVVPMVVFLHSILPHSFVLAAQHLFVSEMIWSLWWLPSFSFSLFTWILYWGVSPMWESIIRTYSIEKCWILKNSQRIHVNSR